MHIKRQKQIKTYLIEELGEDRGTTVFHKQEEILRTLIGNIKDKSKGQRKTLVQTILPSIALYKALSDEEFPEEDVYAYMQKYMSGTVAAKMHASMEKMECIPGFFTLYSSAFRKVMRGSEVHESVQEHGRDYFDVTITKCLWHTACAENNCPEFCRVFCDADNVTYGGLRKIEFARTKTLGYGDDCCDFHFMRK